MKRILSTLIAFLGFSAVFFPLLNNAALAQFTKDLHPKLVVGSLEVHWGLIRAGTLKITRIALKNAGTDTLKILHVQTSCGCTTVKPSKPVLLPGESDTLVVQFNSTGYQGDVKKYVDIETNDPSSPFVTVKFFGTVHAILESTTFTSYLWLGGVPVGKGLKKSFTLRNTTDHPVTVKTAEMHSGELSFTTKQRTIMPADSATFTFTLTPLRTGLESKRIVLKTDDANQTEVPILITFTGVQ
ncbi:MAG: DUF1573 domain-containing protein [Bacteroidota bacterium]|nr:DUF1573 domain-containing protein [Bacteroidota bacterium]